MRLTVEAVKAMARKHGMAVHVEQHRCKGRYTLYAVEGWRYLASSVTLASMHKYIERAVKNKKGER